MSKVGKINVEWSRPIPNGTRKRLKMPSTEIPWDKMRFSYFFFILRDWVCPVFVVNPKVDVAQKGCGYENGSNLATINEEEKRSLQEQVAILSEDATLGDASEAKDDDLEAPSDLGAEITEEGSLGKENVEQVVETEIRAKDPGGIWVSQLESRSSRHVSCIFVHDGRIWKLKNQWSHARLVSIYIPSIRKFLRYSEFSECLFLLRGAKRSSTQDLRQ